MTLAISTTARESVAVFQIREPGESFTEFLFSKHTLTLGGEATGKPQELGV